MKKSNKKEKHKKEDEKLEVEKDESKKEINLEDTVEKIEKEKDDFKDKYIRLMAEFDNYKKRTQSEIGALIRSANEELIVEMLDVVDNMERALNTENKTEDVATIKDGVKLIFDKLNSVLKSKGLVAFDSVGKEFDPELHHAFMQAESNDVPEQHIIQEIEKGYMLNDKVIRHTKVIVSKGKPEKASKDEAKESQNETEKV